MTKANKLLEARKTAKRHMALSKVLDDFDDRIEPRQQLPLGLYLNEDNGQTFEIVECSNDKFAHLHTPDFLYNRTVYSDELIEDMLGLVFEGKISYIGKI